MSELSPQIQKIDGELVRVARCEAQLRLRMGELLERLVERRGHAELGFSSVEAYVLERCEQSGSWSREIRLLARRIREKGLVEIRQAIFAGRISSSMAEVLARFATADNETELLHEASQKTVRAMKAKLTGKSEAALDEEDEDADDERRDLQIRRKYLVTDEERAMLYALRVLIEYLNGARISDENFVDALLGEAETTLHLLRERAATHLDISHLLLDPRELEVIAARLQDARAAARARGRAVPEAPISPPAQPLVAVAEDHPLPKSIRGLDRELRARSHELARRDLQLGRLFRTIHESKTWRKLGYSSPGQYARERLGLSLSSLEHRMTLARRVARHPKIGAAVDEGRIGYEAAHLISRVVGRYASDPLIEAWIERAQRRTVKYLREEVQAVLAAVDFRSETSRWPPADEDLESVHSLQTKIQTGALLRQHLGAFEAAQISVTFGQPRGPGEHRRPLELKMSPDLYAYWVNATTELQALASPRVSFIAFLYASFCSTWLPFLEEFDPEWKEAIQRDRHTCTSPVCERHDVQGHHIKFRAHGGSDAPENITAACAACHLQGIHENRLAVQGKAPNLTWKIGRDPIMFVHGRDRIFLDVDGREGEEAAVA